MKYSVCIAAGWLSMVTAGHSPRHSHHHHVRSEPWDLTLDAKTTYQTIDGFENTTLQTQVLEILFDKSKGAGFSILRNWIGSSKGASIAATGPERPGPLNYTWDKSDNGQVWLSQKAKELNPDLQIYADAWGAPGYMKSTGQEGGGGVLCGVTGSSCESGNWMQVYADYLTKYVQLYAEEGVKISHLGFLNEPSFTPPYSGMHSDGLQAADFLKVLRPTLNRAGLETKVTCCDDFGWNYQGKLLTGIQEADAEHLLDIVTSHTYATHPTYACNTTKHVWITESGLGSNWSTVWYESGEKAEGYVWADAIFDAVELYNLSAYLYWIGAEAGEVDSMLVNWHNNVIEPSGRFWAFAHWSRFVRPGAVRIGHTAAPDGVKSSAFQNLDQSVVATFLNNNTHSVEVSVQIEGHNLKAAEGFVTDNSHHISPMDLCSCGSHTRGTLPPHSQVTFVIPA